MVRRVVARRAVAIGGGGRAIGDRGCAAAIADLLGFVVLVVVM